MKTLEEIGNLQGRSNAYNRWATFGPYYAMFPIDFAFKVVDKYSKPNDYILDPFAGRCSSVYAGGVLGRNSFGIEINPVGWLYGKTKLAPAKKEDVLDRLLDIYNLKNEFTHKAYWLPKFFRKCFCVEVRKLLLAARNHLNWQENDIDASLMSILLVYLHGKLGEGLSNQMRQTKAMGVNYSINWWEKNGFLKPPKINPLEFIVKKIEWRYAKGRPEINTESKVFFGDATIKLEDLITKSEKEEIKFSLLFTSPPYCSIVDYYADQWLRLWLLGGLPYPKINIDKHKRRFNSKTDYYNMLNVVFGRSAKIMKEDATIFVRTDARKFTLNTTKEILIKHFPKHNMIIQPKPFKKRTQTELFNNKNKLPKEKYGEMDIILTRK